MRKKRRLKNWVIITFIVICILGIIISIWNLIIWKNSLKANTKIQEEIKESIIIQEIEETEEVKYIVDFKNLKEQNPDTIAYLKVNNTNIDYVVVKGSNNSYYLKHNFKKEWNSAGWIFSDYKNNFDGTDKNIVIYGHSMKDGSMFGTLRNILQKEWYENEENLQIVLITENETAIYQVFSTYSIIAEDYYINTEFNDAEEYNAFLQTIKSRSIYDYRIDINSSDKILTLSTCTGNGTKRVVLHAKKVDNIE